MSVAGDEGFRDFVVARSPHLLRTAYLLAGDRSSAEDLVQNALLRTYLAWDKVVNADDPWAYSLRILYTTSSHMHRRRRVKEQLGAAPEIASPEPAGVEERDELQHMLLDLPRKQRAVVVLRFYQDLSVEKTAEILGCSSGTVKSQTSKALAKLRNSPALRERTGRSAAK
jgi:RNA polymerase sigma-70 factor (sigma-E family)